MAKKINLSLSTLAKAAKLPRPDYKNRNWPVKKPFHAIHTQRWKYIVEKDSQRRAMFILWSIGETSSKKFKLSHSYAERNCKKMPGKQSRKPTEALESVARIDTYLSAFIACCTVILYCRTEKYIVKYLTFMIFRLQYFFTSCG